jgi:hypothetical protein
MHHSVGDEDATVPRSPAFFQGRGPVPGCPPGNQSARPLLVRDLKRIAWPGRRTSAAVGPTTGPMHSGPTSEVWTSGSFREAARICNNAQMRAAIWGFPQIIPHGEGTAPGCHTGGEWSGPRGTKWHPEWHLTPTNFPKAKRRKHLQGATRFLILGATGVAPCGTQVAPSGTLLAPSWTKGLRPAPFWGLGNPGVVRCWDQRAAVPTTGPALSLPVPKGPAPNATLERFPERPSGFRLDAFIRNSLRQHSTPRFGYPHRMGATSILPDQVRVKLL